MPAFFTVFHTNTYFLDLDAHHLSSIKYQTLFASGSTTASVAATLNGTSAISIKQVIAIKK